MGDLTGRRLADRQDDERQQDDATGPDTSGTAAGLHVPAPRLPRTIFFKPQRRTTMTVTGGLLEIRRRGSSAFFDLTSPETSVEVHGRTGSRRWKVVLSDGRTPAYVIDGSMVDAVEFMRVLRYYRPDLTR